MEQRAEKKKEQERKEAARRNKVQDISLDTLGDHFARRGVRTPTFKKKEYSIEEQDAAIGTLQRHFRGFLGRKLAAKKKQEYERVLAASKQPCLRKILLSRYEPKSKKGAWYRAPYEKAAKDLQNKEVVSLRGAPGPASNFLNRLADCFLELKYTQAHGRRRTTPGFVSLMPVDGSGRPLSPGPGLQKKPQSSPTEAHCGRLQARGATVALGPVVPMGFRTCWMQPGG